METLTPNHEQILARRRELASELVEAAKRGTIHTIDELDPRDTSIEVIQHIRGILKSQGILPGLHNDGQL